MYLPGQACIVQSRNSSFGPEHPRPPFEGAGWLHKRRLDCIPRPHVTEHLPHTPNAPQLPSTAATKKKLSKLK